MLSYTSNEVDLVNEYIILNEFSLHVRLPVMIVRYNTYLMHMLLSCYSQEHIDTLSLQMTHYLYKLLLLLYIFIHSKHGMSTISNAILVYKFVN